MTKNNEKNSRTKLYSEISQWARGKTAERLRQKYAPKAAPKAEPAAASDADGIDDESLEALAASLAAADAPSNGAE